MKRNLYYNGKKIGRDNEDFTPSYNIMGTTFELAAKPEYEGFLTAAWPAPARGGIPNFGAFHGGGSPRMETIAITTSTTSKPAGRLCERSRG